MAEDVDGIHPAAALQEVGHLRQAVLAAIKHHHFVPRIAPCIGQLLPVGQVIKNKDDFGALRCYGVMHGRCPFENNSKKAL